MWLLYQALLALALGVAAPFLLARRGRHYLSSLPGRLGRHSGPAPTGAVWLHAVSVGEVGVAATLAAALPDDLPLLVTTITPTGQAQARRTFHDRATVTYLPFDLGFAVRRFLRRFVPRALVLAEGDLWPLLLRLVKRRGLPVYVVNGRISDRSFRRLRVLRPFIRPLLAPVDRFAVQSEEDRRRLLALGVDPARVRTTGNLKFETPEPRRNVELEEALARLAGGRTILVAGSTMAGEEEQVLEALRQAGGGDRALLVLAPRHPERWPQVTALLTAQEWAFCRRSSLPATGRPAIVLLDSLGDLAGLYRIAGAAFIGGTLVPTGGHNPLEAARFGVPIAVGPAMDNFRDIASHFDRHGAWRRVADAAELAAAWREWLLDPAGAERLGARGAALVERHRGALASTLEVLSPLLQVAAP